MADKRMTRIKRLLTEFERATSDWAFVGSQHPDDWETIEQQYVHKRALLLSAIEEVINQGAKE